MSTSDGNPPEPSGEQAFSVDDLARAAGTLSSTVRLYQNRGLLPPPRREGRRAVYGAHHLARLRLIADLQERGHSLAGIKDLVDGWDSGRGVPAVLGVAGWTVTSGDRVSLEEIVASIGEISADDVRRAVDLGLVDIDETGAVTADAQVLALGSGLVELGVPIGAVLDEWEALTGLTDRIAERFASVLTTHLWEPSAAPTPDDLTRLSELLEQLGDRARQVTTLALDRSLRRLADETARSLVDP